MAVMYESCPQCGKPAKVQVGQHLDSARVLWHKSYSCTSCHAEIQSDGSDELDSAGRDAILVQEGNWLLDVRANNKTEAAQVLRAALGLPVSDAARLMKQMPGVVAHGTRAEMERLQVLLSMRSLKSDVIMQSPTVCVE